MIDILSKVLGIILAFLMLVYAPLLILYTLAESNDKHLILSEATQFVDKVRDTMAVSEDDLNELYARVNSHGLVVSVEVKRLVKFLDSAGRVTYFVSDQAAAMSSFSKGDGVLVQIKEITISPGRQFLFNILGADSGDFSLELSGIVG